MARSKRSLSRKASGKRRVPQRAPYKRTKKGGLPPSEIVRRKKISRTMKARVVPKKFRDSRGRFSRRLFYGMRDVREKSSDDVDYEVPFVLAQDHPPAAPYREVEMKLDEADDRYANFNVTVFADYRPLIERIMERQGLEDREARDVIRQMEDEARESDEGVSLVDAVPRERRSAP